jgi:hypothetical protein
MNPNNITEWIKSFIIHNHDWVTKLTFYHVKQEAVNIPRTKKGMLKIT